MKGIPITLPKGYKWEVTKDTATNLTMARILPDGKMEYITPVTLELLRSLSSLVGWRRGASRLLAGDND